MRDQLILLILVQGIFYRIIESSIVIIYEEVIEAYSATAWSMVRADLNLLGAPRHDDTGICRLHDQLNIYICIQVVQKNGMMA